MIRSMMQAYVKNSLEAVQLYQKAFDAKILSEYKNDQGNYFHVELDLFGQIFALSESNEKTVAGNTMQFCLQLGIEDKRYISLAYEVLKEGAEILVPLGPCSYSELMVSFIDKFGVNWCLFV